MKKTKTFKVTIEGLTLQDIIEILALRGEKLPENIKKTIFRSEH